MTVTSVPRRPRVRADRTSDRLVTLAAIVLALGFLVAAAATTLLPVETRLGAWLPLHLALAGAATTAIAGVMPFFTAALGAAPPSDPRLRATAVAAVAVGAGAVALGVAGRASGLAVAGGVSFIAGVALAGIVALAPLRHGLGPRRGVVTAGYVAALCSVAVGAGLATVFLAGWMPLVEAWARARPAHAWLNLVGFVSLTIATTLLHFFPTVIGARIARHRSAIVAVAGLAAGPALVALGGVAGADLLARFGAVVALVGAVGLAVYAGQIWRTRARWTSDMGWHLVAMGGLVSAIGWFVVGMAIAAGRMVALGIDGRGWSLEAVAGPLVAGWIGLAIVASATHLVPSIGPGSPVAHAEQRRMLGRVALTRLLAIELGVAALAVGLPLHVDALVGAGVLLVATGLAVTVALLAAAVRVGLAGQTRGTTAAGA